MFFFQNFRSLEIFSMVYKPYQLLIEFFIKKVKKSSFQIHFKPGHSDILNGFKSSSVKMSDFEV